VSRTYASPPVVVPVSTPSPGSWAGELDLGTSSIEATIVYVATTER
jgi:hypothetical protein